MATENLDHACHVLQTDGKAARSLVKLQLFQQFYVLGENPSAHHTAWQ